MSRFATTFVLLCTLAVVAIVLGTRWLGPHDLYEKDQPKTLAYTADVVRHGRFSLPRDVIYQPTTKPPMVNWIAAAAVAVSGSWGEPTLKLPSTLGVLATAALVYATAARRANSVVGLLAVGVFFTFGSDVRHGSVLRLSYLARPDMLLTAFCTGAWACFTVAAERPTTRTAAVPAFGGWLCVTAAALTKGPAAALPAIFAIVYPLVAAAWRKRPARDSNEDTGGTPVPRAPRVVTVLKTWPLVGLPVVVLGVGTWLFFAARQDVTHVRQVIWGAEVAGRLTETPEGFRKPVYYAVMWFVTKAWPWGAIASFGLAATAWLPRLRRTAAGPAALYLAIVLIGLSIPAAKRMDYLLPAFAPAAVLVAALLTDVVRGRVLGAFGVVVAATLIVLTLAGHGRWVDWLVPAVTVFAVIACLWVERRRPVPLAVLAVVPLALAVTFAHAYSTKFIEVKNQWSDHAVAFVEQVRRHVRDDQTLYVIVRGKHPLTTLLGRHPGSYLTPADLKAANFVILPEQPDLPAVVTSEPLPEGFAELENRPLVRLGLYRDVPVDRLVAAQKACGEWTTIENPYHSPGTVYRDE